MAERLNLEEYLCDALELEIEFPLDQFDVEAFRRSASLEDDSKERFYATYKSSEYPGKQHAHIDVRLGGKTKGRVRVYFARGSESGSEPISPLPMEECFEWVGGFFRTESLRVSVEGRFKFGSIYSPIFPLPFPMISEHQILAGTSVTGMSLRFPSDARLRSVIVQRWGSDTLIQAKMSIETDPTGLTVSGVLKGLWPSVGLLVRKTGDMQ